MNTSKSQMREHMRRDLYATIRRNIAQQGETLSRHEIVEVLASVLSGRLEIIRPDARKQPNA